MPYIGNPPAERFTSFAYQDLTGGSGTSFTLDNAVGNPQEIEVFVNNVRQEPGVAYTVSGTALTMTGSIATTDDFYVVFQGKAIQTATHPSDRALTATDGTFTGDLTVDTNTLHVDSANNRVGIGTTSPATATGGGIDIERAAGASVRIDDTTNSVTGELQVYSAGMNLATVTNHDLIFSTNNAERGRFLTGGGLSLTSGNLVLTSGYGIDFSATANSSGTVTHEIFDDYEIGSWTPTIDFGGGSTSVAYAYQEGVYTKIGRQVIAHAYLDLTSKGSSSGQIRFGGLPFNVANVLGSSSLDGAGFFTYIDSISGVYSIAIAAQDSTEKAIVYGQTSSGGNFSTPITNSAINNDFECRFTLIYVAG